MVYVPVILGAFALQASAFPFVLENIAANAAALTKRETPAVAASKARTNCGEQGACTTFDASEQLVSITGNNAYQSPSASDIRGPCPGLNAAANHNYLPRSGVPTIADTITGLGAAYGMSVDLAAALAAIAVTLDGDPLTETWSIGGPPPAPNNLGIDGAPQGISYSHDNYENDASIGRADAYLNNGNAYSLIIKRFASAYAAHNGSGFYDLDLFAQNYLYKAQQSIKNNPYAFWGPFSGLVAPAAYNFVINFMSNHTEDQPSGYLNGDIFKTFFAVEGEYPNFKWLPGQERIPDNWYRRPTDNAYSAVGVVEDLVVQFLAYPNSFLLGGNTGTTESFTGFDFGDLTGGVFDGSTLLTGNNLACFFYQAALAGIPNGNDLDADLTKAIAALKTKYITPAISGLSCPQLETLELSSLSKYPGYKYHPTGPANNQ